MKQVTCITAIAFLIFSCKDADNKQATADAAKSDSTAGASTTDTTGFVPVDSATSMKAWMEYMTPGDAHKMMAKFNGTWNGDMTMWMTEGAPPTKTTTKTVNAMILGGRYQQSKHTGSFDGMPFEGVSTMGYDNAKKVFVSSWIDNMGSGIMNTSGPWDSLTKTITLTGKITDPVTGKDCNVREIFKIIDDNTQLMEMYGPDPKTGKEFKMMEIKYTRKG